MSGKLGGSLSSPWFLLLSYVVASGLHEALILGQFCLLFLHAISGCWLRAKPPKPQISALLSSGGPADLWTQFRPLLQNPLSSLLHLVSSLAM